MEKWIHGIYSDEILKIAGEKFGINSENLKNLGGFESYVYEFNKEGKEYILRITHSSHRTSDNINGELEWVNYLAKNDVSVSGSIMSKMGNYVEVIPAGETYFSAVVFNKAGGRRPMKEDFNKDLFENWGRLIGKMHKLTMEFTPSKPQYKRHEWFEDGYSDFEKHLPASQIRVKESGRKITDYMNALPRGKDTYGLIHTDAHAGNFFIEDGKLNVFDFDDSCYKWFASDIAIALFYNVVNIKDEKAKLEFTDSFMKSFLKGYYEENYLDPYWLEIIPAFLKMREFNLYVAIHASFDSESIDPWCASYIDQRKKLIENETPFVVYDFKKAINLG